jgi:hypothetical protein
MRIRVQVLVESDQGSAVPLHIEEVACFERDQLSPETLGLRLEEAKQMLAGVQHVMTKSLFRNRWEGMVVRRDYPNTPRLE